MPVALGGPPRERPDRILPGLPIPDWHPVGWRSTQPSGTTLRQPASGNLSMRTLKPRSAGVAAGLLAARDPPVLFHQIVLHVPEHRGFGRQPSHRAQSSLPTSAAPRVLADSAAGACAMRSGWANSPPSFARRARLPKPKPDRVTVFQALLETGQARNRSQLARIPRCSRAWVTKVFVAGIVVPVEPPGTPDSRRGWLSGGTPSRTANPMPVVGTGEHHQGCSQAADESWGRTPP
jgi:hypothetical protein